MLKSRFYGLFLVLLAAAAPSVRGANPSGYPSFGADSGRTYVGVLGAVGRRKVYEFSTPSPDIQEVLQAAGGPTTRANGNIRIVRGGKAGTQVFLTPTLRMPLRSGDVIVVDGVNPRRSPIDLASASSATSNVPIALINVLDRPVVMALKPDDATVERIVGLLGQEAEVAETVRVLPTGGLAPGELMPGKDSTLPAGAVLVFNRSALDLSRIPKSLPPAAPVEGGSSATSDEPRPAPPALNAVTAAPIEQAAPPARELTLSAPAEPSSAPGPSLLTTEQPFGETLPRATRSTLEVAEAPRATPVQSALPLPRGTPEHRAIPARTANSLSGIESRPQESPRLDAPRGEAPLPQPNLDPLPRAATPPRTEYLPPPEAIAEARRAGQVDMLPASPDAGPGLRPAQLPEEQVEPIVVGRSEPLSSGSRMLAQNRAETALASVDTVGISEPLSSRPKRAVAALATGADEEDGSNMEVAAAWGILGAAALAAASWSYRRRKRRPAIAMTASTATSIEEDILPEQAVAEAITERIERRLEAVRTAPVRAVSTTERTLRKSMRTTATTPTRSRLQELVANELPIDIEPINLSGPIDVYGSPRTAPQHRVDVPHASVVARPHFSTQTEVVAETAVQAAPVMAPAAHSPTVPSGHRVDEAHGDGTGSPAMPPRPHIGERKSDVLERVLTGVQEGSRHVGSPHIAAAHLAPATAASESVLEEGAAQK